MVKISGYVYIGIGVVMYIVSAIVNHKNQNSTLLLFIYISYLFLAYGIARVAISKIFGKKKSENAEGIANVPELGEMEQDIQDEQTWERQNLPSGGQAGNRYHNPVTANRAGPSLANSKNAKLHPMHQYVGYCAGCATPMRRINNYCHRCGKKQPTERKQAGTPV